MDKQVLRDHQDADGSRVGPTGVEGREGLDAEEHRTLHGFWKLRICHAFQAGPLRLGRHPSQQRRLTFFRLARRYGAAKPRDALQFSVGGIQVCISFTTEGLRCLNSEMKSFISNLDICMIS